MEQLSVFIKENQILLIILLIWAIFWKGFALWKSARRGEKFWFIALLILNTFGILEILYLFVFSEKSNTALEIPIEKDIV